MKVPESSRSLVGGRVWTERLFVIKKFESEFERSDPEEFDRGLARRKSLEPSATKIQMISDGHPGTQFAKRLRNLENGI